MLSGNNDFRNSKKPVLFTSTSFLIWSLLFCKDFRLLHPENWGQFTGPMNPSLDDFIDSSRKVVGLLHFPGKKVFSRPSSS